MQFQQQNGVMGVKRLGNWGQTFGLHCCCIHGCEMKFQTPTPISSPSFLLFSELSQLLPRCLLLPSSADCLSPGALTTAGFAFAASSPLFLPEVVVAAMSRSRFFDGVGGNSGHIRCTSVLGTPDSQFFDLTTASSRRIFAEWGGGL